MRIYIAGPMTGLPEFNYPAFHEAARRLRELGHEVLNPAENPEPPCKSWQGYMRMALAQLVTCDTVALLDGWEQSKGARIEFRTATDLGLSVWCLGPLTDMLRRMAVQEERICDEPSHHHDVGPMPASTPQEMALRLCRGPGSVPKEWLDKVLTEAADNDWDDSHLVTVLVQKRDDMWHDAVRTAFQGRRR